MLKRSQPIAFGQEGTPWINTAVVPCGASGVPGRPRGDVAGTGSTHGVVWGVGVTLTLLGTVAGSHQVVPARINVSVVESRLLVAGLKGMPEVRSASQQAQRPVRGRVPHMEQRPG